jgi:hypothetical protein
LPSASRRPPSGLAGNVGRLATRTLKHVWARLDAKTAMSPHPSPYADLDGSTIRLRAGLAVLAATLMAALGAAPALASRPEAGVSVSNPGPAQVADLKALGTHWVRMFVSWRAMQPTRGAIAPSSFASYEQLFSTLPAGTRVILDVFGTPQWETGSSDEHAPPANPNEYAAFLGALAQRWAGRVAAYEIWNEEDDARWWNGGANPAAYTALLKATYPIIKAADPHATVVLGGLTGNDYPYLQGVYAAGGKGSFDAVGVHTDTACNILSPYDFLRGADNRMIPDSFLAYREVHATMLANGDDKPIWMTELSWRTTSASCSEGAWAGQKPEGVTSEQQATYLSQAYHCMAQDRYLQVALWFPLQDTASVLSGLVRASGVHKPSFAAMRSYAQNGDQLQEPCGIFTGPKITVHSPGNSVSYSGPLPIHVSATSSAGVFRIALRIDGKLIRNYDGSTPYPSMLSGALHWQGAKHISLGRHTLTFLAYDKLRNISEASVTIVHAKGRTRCGRVAKKSRHARKKRHCRAASRRAHKR